MRPRSSRELALEGNARLLRCASGDVLSGLAVLESIRAHALRVRALRDWLGATFVSTGRMNAPSAITEPGARSVCLHEAAGRSSASDAAVDELLQVARSRVVASLRSLTSCARDDRFVHAAIFAGRVRRVGVGSTCFWVACPGEQDAFSSVVLSLFAAHRLQRGEAFDEELVVCDECGRVALDPRRRCLACDGHDSLLPSARSL